MGTRSPTIAQMSFAQAPAALTTWLGSSRRPDLRMVAVTVVPARSRPTTSSAKNSTPIDWAFFRNPIKRLCGSSQPSSSDRTAAPRSSTFIDGYRSFSSWSSSQTTFTPIPPWRS